MRKLSVSLANKTGEDGNYANKIIILSHDAANTGAENMLEIYWNNKNSLGVVSAQFSTKIYYRSKLTEIFFFRFFKIPVRMKHHQNMGSFKILVLVLTIGASQNFVDACGGCGPCKYILVTFFLRWCYVEQICYIHWQAEAERLVQNLLNNESVSTEYVIVV